MKPGDVVLAALTPGGFAPHSPVQVQKLLFLIDENIASEFGGRQFDFQPYHYGPFDPTVYDVLAALEREGLVEICPGARWSTYRLTASGKERGDSILSKVRPKAQEYLQKLSETVRRMSFTELVSAIYKAYPGMRKNSVFEG